MVADSNNNRIQIFDQTGNFVKAFGNRGSGPGQFNSPGAVCIQGGGSNNILVSDDQNHRVQIFNSDCTFLAEIGGGGSSSQEGRFNQPRGMISNARGDIVVADWYVYTYIIHTLGMFLF